MQKRPHIGPQWPGLWMAAWPSCSQGWIPAEPWPGGPWSLGLAGRWRWEEGTMKLDSGPVPGCFSIPGEFLSVLGLCLPHCYWALSLAQE